MIVLPFFFNQSLMFQKSNSGTTAVCVLIIKKKMYVAWVGDSKVGLASDVVSKNLVRSHRPNNQVRVEFFYLYGALETFVHSE